MLADQVRQAVLAGFVCSTPRFVTGSGPAGGAFEFLTELPPCLATRIGCSVRLSTLKPAVVTEGERCSSALSLSWASTRSLSGAPPCLAIGQVKPGRLFWLACWTDVWGFPRGRQPRGRNPPDGVTAELDSEAPILQGGFFCFRPLGSEEPGGGALLSGNAVSGAKSTPGSSISGEAKTHRGPSAKGLSRFPGRFLG